MKTNQASDIRRKLQPAAMGPRTSMNWLMGLAFGVFNNRGRLMEQKGFRNKERHNLLVAALASCTMSGLPTL